MKFFIPGGEGRPEVTEGRWQQWLRESGAHPGARRVYSLVYSHDGNRYEAVVGNRRREFRRRTGPRGGYIKDAGYERTGNEVGSQVAGIVHRGDALFIFSFGPPFLGRANPEVVGLGSVKEIDYFDK